MISSDVVDTRTVDLARTIDEIDADYLKAIEDDDLDRQADLAAEPAAKKPSEAEKEEAAKQAELAALQSRVPFELSTEDRPYYGDQKRKIDQWADDWGTYPRQYRSYSIDEWSRAIDLLADTVMLLSSTHAEYQRATGLYVEEYQSDLLLVRSKEWQLTIQVPSKSSAKGKTFKLEAAVGKDAWGGAEKRADAFAEFLTVYVPADNRDILLDICCQYLRDVRIRVNRLVWGQENPDLAYLLEKS